MAILFRPGFAGFTFCSRNTPLHHRPAFGMPFEDCGERGNSGVQVCGSITRLRQGVPEHIVKIKATLRKGQTSLRYPSFPPLNVQVHLPGRGHVIMKCFQVSGMTLPNSEVA